MKEMGMPTEDIAVLTNLTSEEIEAL